MQPAQSEVIRVHLEARTRFFDQAVLDALGAGITQVVIAGAGYDDRALRFRSEGVRWFELDHPATQADKRRRLEELGADTSSVAFAAADFGNDDVAAALAAAGHAQGQATLFLCEGLLVYFEPPGIVGLLGALANRAGAGSTLVASLAVHRDGIDSSAVVRFLNDVRPANDEPWRTILPAGEHLQLLHRAGWREERGVDEAEVSAEAEPGRSLFVVAARDRG
jgi:methyltransferase (TIGR00027 family)